MNGILVINKEKDYTSHDVVAIVKGITKEKHLGHTGTLDPNATGVLPICFGYATRLIEYIDKAPKRYIASAKLGITTDTQDIWGNIISEMSFEPISKNKIEELLPMFIGETEQLPPKYSAVRVNGRHLYSYAYNGESVEIPKRTVMIYDLKLLDFDLSMQEFSFEIECGRGTYVRTVCHDIGQLLGMGACLTSLERTSACGFCTDDAITIEQLRSIDPCDIEKIIKPIERSVAFMNRIDINENQRLDFSNGKHLKADQKEMAADEPVCVFCGEELCGIGIWDNPGRLKPSKVFVR